MTNWLCELGVVVVVGGVGGGGLVDVGMSGKTR